MAVMFCLAAATLLCGVLLKVTLSEQRQGRVAEWRLQAEWLAESGLERAAAQLAASSEFAGETWQLTADDLGADATGTVTIEVEAVDGRSDLRIVRVRADYLRDGERRARHSAEVKVQLKTANVRITKHTNDTKETAQ
jgi:hypothetical protein